jgi:hypothetical protein
MDSDHNFEIVVWKGLDDAGLNSLISELLGNQGGSKGEANAIE